MSHHGDRDSVGTHYSQFHSHISHKETEMTHICKRLLESGEIKDPVEFLRNSVLAQGYSGILGLGRNFREISDSDDGILNLQQFTRCLTDAGYELSAEQAEEIFNRFDGSQDDGVKIGDLIAMIRPEMSSSRKAIVDTAFNKMDKEGTGVIPISVLKRFYNVKSNPRYVGGIETEEEIKKTFIDHFEEQNHGDAEVTREDFLNYYSAVSASCDDDTYFDLLIRQFYKL